MKRFYKDVTAAPEILSGGYRILLDGRPVKTPGRVDLICPSQAIAEIVCGEWREQGEHIRPETMPATQFINTLVDKLPAQRAEITAMILKYLDSDLICYPASEPEGLVARQSALWSPVRSWFEKKYGYTLKITTDLRALKQDANIHKALEADVAVMGDLRFVLLQNFVPAGGSIILSLAFLHGAVDPAGFLECIFAEEDFQATVTRADLYVQDPMIEKKKIAIGRDLNAASALLDTL
jgi:chaperone required for assembly of F1-ATPase